jgi:hypothetical protein
VKVGLFLEVLFGGGLSRGMFWGGVSASYQMLNYEFHFRFTQLDAMEKSFSLSPGFNRSVSH